MQQKLSQLQIDLTQVDTKLESPLKELHEEVKRVKGKHQMKLRNFFD